MSKSPLLFPRSAHHQKVRNSWTEQIDDALHDVHSLSAARLVIRIERSPFFEYEFDAFDVSTVVVR